MNRLREYLPGDAQLVPVQGHQAGEQAMGLGYDAAKGPAMTLLSDGDVVACAGLAEIWEGRWFAWALFGELDLRQFALIRSACRRVIAATPGRVEATASFPAAERFLTGLGFEKEGVMRSYYRGCDYALYAQVVS